MESTCRKCIKPNVNPEFVNKYNLTNLPFFDISSNNKNFYCISEAKSEGYVI